MSNWNLYQTTHKGLGTLCEVKINYKEKLISRRFSKDAITVNGNTPRFDSETINFFFQNEVKWIKKLKSEWIPKTIDINLYDQIITQEFYNEDLLCFKKELPQLIPDLSGQVIEMYKFFKKMNVFKRNGSLSNLTHYEGHIKAFDFKWALPRPIGLSKELYSYDHYLCKINPQLPQQLKDLL